MVSRPRIRAALIDLSGTLFIGSSPTQNAVAAVKRLKAVGLPIRFCSNASKESTVAVCNRMRKIGFELSSDSEVWTSLGAASRLLQLRGLKKPFLLLTDSAKEEFKDNPTPDPSTPFDSVVIGLAPSCLDYEHLNSAFRILKGEASAGQRRDSPSTNPKTSVPLIATHKAKYYASDLGGTLSLGPGPFVTALESAAGVRAEVMGKPSRGFFETVIKSFDDSGHESGVVAVIGDDIEADLGGAAPELGLWRVLVKTGKYRSGDESRPGVEPPNEIAESFSAWVNDLLRSEDGSFNYDAQAAA